MTIARHFAWMLASAAFAIGAGLSEARADDTEIFFNKAAVSQFGAPNVLIMIDTSAWMGCPVGSTENDPSKCLALDGTTIDKDDDYAGTRIEAVRVAIIKVLQDIQARGLSVNVGFMRGSNNGNDGSNAAKGGFIGQEVALLDSAQMDDFIDWLCPVGTGGCNLVRPNSGGVRMNMLATAQDERFSKQGSARGPLTEMMYEAYTYYAGNPVEWGTTGTIGPSYPFPGKDFDPPNSQVWSDAVTVPNCPPGGCVYKSPISDTCQSNYIIMLSLGRFASDTGNDKGANGISNLPFFASYTGPGTTAQPGKCSANTSVKYTGFQLSDCPDDLAYSLRRGGFHSDSTKASSSVYTYTIGFDVPAGAGNDANAATNLLKLIATAGGGRYYDANDAAQLETALTAIFDEVVIQSASFTSPTVSVNAFNRTLNLNDLYMAVFQPSKTARWKGNIKKYTLASNGDILDANKVVAVGNGLFLPNRQSLWSAGVDGDDVTKGGAASKMKPPPTTATRAAGDRKVITNQNGATGPINYELLSIKGLAQIDKDLLLNISCTPTLTPDPTCPTADQLVDWAYGMDVLDKVPATGNSNFTESRKDMGDPLHTRPAVVIYGGTTASPNIDDAVVYAVTNDGYLHSFDTVTGSENWAFIPWDLLGRLGDLYLDYPSNPRTSLGLDGIIRVLRLDRNFDGIIDSSAGDRVYLYMGMRRGGQNYYALDVTDKSNPKLLWKLGPSDLPNVGQTWSTPQVTRMDIPGTTQNADELVLVMGGGYDQLREDAPLPKAYSDVSVNASLGAAVYVVDAISGRLLWWAGPDIGTFTPAPTIQPAKSGVGALRHSIPGDVRVIDLTGDGYADLMYAADLGGQVWRFEVDKSATSKANAIRAGLLATLGDTGIAGARRFFAAPDVALIRCQGQQWLNIAIGSGNRELPITDKNYTEDRLYTLRDRAMLNPINWSTYVVLKDQTVDATTGIVDVTPDSVTGVQPPVTTGASGWQVDLAVLSADAGEKAIVEARTFENTIFFTTFVPKLRTDNTIVCSEAIGYNYLYVLNACDGRPNPLYLAQTGLPVVAQGLAGQLNQKGIAPEIAFLFPSPDNAPGSGNRRPTPIGLCGAEACGRFPGYGPKRTFWREQDAD